MYPNLNQINPIYAHSSYFIKIYFNIILPSTPRSFKWSLVLQVSPSQSVVCIFPHTHATCPALLIHLDLMARAFGQHCNHEAPKHSVPVSYYFLLPGPNHCPQNPVLEHPQFVLSALTVLYEISHSHKRTANIALVDIYKEARGGAVG